MPSDPEVKPRQRLATMRGESESKYNLRDGGSIVYHHDYTCSVPGRVPANAKTEVTSQIVVERGASTTVVEIPVSTVDSSGTPQP